MEDKKDHEILAEIYRNCQLAIQSITDILPETIDNKLREEIIKQHEGYEKICSEAAVIGKNNNIELKEPSMMKKAMMYSSIKLNTFSDDSTSHIAEMLVRGTVMGITSLKSTESQIVNNSKDDIINLLEKLIELEEEYEKKLKTFI